MTRLKPVSDAPPFPFHPRPRGRKTKQTPTNFDQTNRKNVTAKFTIHASQAEGLERLEEASEKRHLHVRPRRERGAMAALQIQNVSSTRASIAVEMTPLRAEWH